VETSNEKKNRLLGEPYGTANSKLKKILLFDLAKRLDEDFCYRCGIKISSLEEFSIEHKQSWMYADNPIQMFYSLDNIAFSHIDCNVKAGIRPNKKYSSVKERKAAEFGRYYQKKSEQVLERKRKRYRERLSP